MALRGHLAAQETKKGAVLPANRFLQHTAVRPIADHALQAEPAALTESHFGQDFSQVAVHAASDAARSELTPPCPVTPTRCPFGGACHTCPARVQAKLAISQPGDEYEREADRVADAVTAMPGSQVSVSAEAPGTASHLDTAAMVREAVTGPGQPLDAAARADLEPRLGFDLGQVRLHTDRAAAQAARRLGAHAITIGHDIAFGAGRYAPWTGAGLHLLTHELAHTVQQTQLNPASSGMVMGRWSAVSPGECADVGQKWLRKVVVEQETPQSATLYWNDGTTEADECSAGKGLCCVDQNSSEGTACTVSGSRVYGTDCTPITEGDGYPIVHRDRNHKTIPFWSEFVPSRGIALHEYSPVDGTPLSHGCVRLHENTARRIFCGARQNETMVQVRGFARPMCNHPALQAEWLSDFATGGLDLAQFDGDADTQASIRETRAALNRAFGRTLTPQEIRQLTAADIPRCTATGRRPSTEERRGTYFQPVEQQPGTTPVVTPGPEPTQILAASGFDRFLAPFQAALAATRSLRAARTAVRAHGLALWRAAVARAQGATANADDRPLYWARLELTRGLGQWQPRFALSDTDRLALMELLERTSRGMETAAFSARGRDVKRILIGGFDPFYLELTTGGDRRRSNPSGAAVLAMDSRRISDGGITAEIQGVIFPVRYADFDAGMAETFFRPFLAGSRPADMIMTISMGAGAEFEVEEYAGRRRSLGGFAENAGQTTPGTPSSPVAPPGLAAGPEFLRTALPTAAIRGALGRTTALPEETEITEIPAGASSPVTRTSGGPTTATISVAGSGGGFLSNEIFYRTSLLRSSTGADVPVGHLHTPLLEPPGGTGISDTAFVQARNTIVAQIERILKATLPQL